MKQRNTLVLPTVQDPVNRYILAIINIYSTIYKTEKKNHD